MAATVLSGRAILARHGRTLPPDGSARRRAVFRRRSPGESRLIVRILVTGATGFIGLEVAQQLARSDHQVRLLVRRLSRAPLVATLQRHGGVDVVHGDLAAPASIERAVAGIDAIVHLAGRATFEPYARLAPSLVDGSRTLARAAAHAGVAHIVFGSSAFVHAGDGTPIDRRTAVSPVLDYGRAKVDAEAALQEETDRAGIGLTILRLPHVYGPHSLLFGLVRRRLVLFPGRGDNVFAQLHVADAARAIIAAAEQGVTGQFPIADRSRATWNDFFAVLLTYAPRTRVLHVPSWLAVTASRAVGPALGRLKMTMVAPDTIRGWNLDVQVDDNAIWQAVGLEPVMATIADGIPATLDDMVAFRWRHPTADWA